MKFLLILGLVSASFFLTGCDTLVVERHHSHSGYYSGGYYGGGGYYGRRPYDRRAVVVVDGPGYYRRPAPVYYGGGARVAYSKDKHGRYYWRNGHKVYVERW